MKKANVTITDIKEKTGLYVIACEIKAGKFKFSKAIAVRPQLGEISVKSFKIKLADVIIKELAHRKAIEPIKRLQKEGFVIEYENESKNTKN